MSYYNLQHKKIKLCLVRYAGADKLGHTVGTIVAQNLAENVGYQEAFFFCAAAGFFSLLVALTLFYVVEDRSKYLKVMLRYRV